VSGKNNFCEFTALRTGRIDSRVGGHEIIRFEVRLAPARELEMWPRERRNEFGTIVSFCFVHVASNGGEAPIQAYSGKERLG
jgi:hypothetical protein